MHNLVTFAQFKKRQKTPKESTFSKLKVLWHMFDYLNELAIAVIISVVFKITKSSLLGLKNFGIKKVLNSHLFQEPMQKSFEIGP